MLETIGKTIENTKHIFFSFSLMISVNLDYIFFLKIRKYIKSERVCSIKNNEINSGQNFGLYLKK